MQFVYGKRISTSCLICTNIGSRVRIFLGPSRSTLAFFQQFMARSNLLYKLKKIHVTKHCRETDSVQRHPHPSAHPEKTRIPRLYYMREIGRGVTLPWTWDSKSGDNFVRKWNDSLAAPEFKDNLMRCAYWWIRKVSVTYLIHCHYPSSLFTFPRLSRSLNIPKWLLPQGDKKSPVPPTVINATNKVFDGLV